MKRFDDDERSAFDKTTEGEAGPGEAYVNEPVVACEFESITAQTFASPA